MKTYIAEELLAMSKAEIWALPLGRCRIQFQDATIDAWARTTIFSWYCWEVHRRWPNTPLLSRHHQGERPMAGDTMEDMLSDIVWDSYDAYSKNGHYDLEEHGRCAYQISNEIFNDLTNNCSEFVTSISILDFLQAHRHPAIRQANEEVQNAEFVNNATIERAYAKIGDALRNDPELKHNAIASALRAKLVSNGQIMQCLGPRGFVTDADSHMFKNAIRVSYTKGLTKLEDSMKDSRSATKALFFSKNAVADSEYNNRIIQFSASILQNLHMEDCGSKGYIHFTIKNRRTLMDMRGIHYYVPDTREERTITANDTHLVGTTVQMRSVFTCLHRDRIGVCVKCMGDIGLSIMRGDNLGHVSATETQAKIGQSILSTKHLDGSGSVEEFVLQPYALDFLHVTNETEFVLSPKLEGRPFHIVVSDKDVPNIHDLQYVTDARELAATRISEISSMIFRVPHGEGEMAVEVIVSAGNRKPHFSMGMLEHIKRVGWRVTEEGNYCIDMTGWDANQNIMEMPMTQFSMPEYMKSIETFIKSKPSPKLPMIVDYPTPSAALMAFHDLVTVKLNINVSHLQVVVLTTMIESVERNDYNLPIDRSKGTFVSHTALMENRSLAAYMAFQDQPQGIFGVKSYIHTVRPPHILDNLLLG